MFLWKVASAGKSLEIQNLSRIKQGRGVGWE